MNTNAKGLDEILRKVQGLIAKAESTEFPGEADAFRKGAEALMAKYRIEESMLAAAGPVGGVAFAPEWRDWPVCLASSKFRVYYTQVAQWVVRHVGAQGVFTYRDIHGERWVVLETCGYASDLRYGEMLLTSCLLAFGERMEPKVDPELGEQVNAYRLRRAGLELRELAIRLRGPEANTKSIRRVLRMLVLAECKARQEDPEIILGAGNNMRTFRASYGQGFADEIYYRLERMRYEAGDQSQALVLAGRADAVKEAFYQRHPRFRPSTTVAKHKECSKCKRAKSGSCREHTYRAPKSQPENYRARRAGESAAAGVDLGNTKRLT